MDTRTLLTDHLERIRELYAGALDGLDPATAHHRPGGTGNPIAWLLGTSPACRTTTSRAFRRAAGLGDLARPVRPAPRRMATPATATPPPRSTPCGSRTSRCSAATTRRCTRPPSATSGTSTSRARPGRRRALGTAGHRRGPDGQRHRRLPPAPRAGGLRPGPTRRFVESPGAPAPLLPCRGGLRARR